MADSAPLRPGVSAGAERDHQPILSHRANFFVCEPPPAIPQLTPQLTDPSGGQLKQPGDRAGVFARRQNMGHAPITRRERFEPIPKINPQRGQVRRGRMAVLDEGHFPVAVRLDRKAVMPLASGRSDVPAVRAGADMATGAIVPDGKPGQRRGVTELGLAQRDQPGVSQGAVGGDRLHRLFPVMDGQTAKR